MVSAARTSSDLWSLVLDSNTIDPGQLFQAIQAEITHPPHDFRTRVLLRDSILALEKRWGSTELRARIPGAAQAVVDRILDEDLGDRGFPTLEKRLVEHTRAETIEQFLREIGLGLQQPCRLMIGGSSGLILLGMLSRQTDDVDAVDQSHYLPDQWETRVRSYGTFGHLQVFLADPVDVALGKLFSRREKDLDDLRVLAPVVGRTALEDRLRSAGARLRSDAQLQASAQRNWYILFGDDLPV